MPAATPATTSSWTSERLATAGAVVACGWLVVLVVVDVLVSTQISPDPLFALAPLIACAVLSPRATTVFGVAAVALTVWSGWWNGDWSTGQQWVRLLEIVLVSVAAVVIATVRVRREQRLARVMNIAETAQRVILPKLPDSAGGVRVAGRYLSAAEDAVVGGDLYDCSVTEGYIRFIVGDVRGKGIAAVEQAARVIRAFRQAAATKAELVGVVTDMDTYLTPFFTDEEFVTAVLVDISDEEPTVTSCGHPPALLISADGSASFVEVFPGLPLGIGHTSRPTALGWGPGDRLLLYTDGVSEARDAAGTFYPLLENADKLRAGSLDEALDALLDDLQRHVARGRLGDDLAVVMLENIAGASTGS
jgi:sigma-B regulation protein RsbU (phosphoserine phosphatase)